jgi:hypothetical protein
MRFLVALSLTVVSVNLGAQQPAAPAGANRPNLKVLQTLPESQLFPVMNLVATSLGVRCEFCHVQENSNLSRTPSNVGGWQWARDDKAQKRRALEMMRMVVDLNATRFAGEHRVTCYTCHQGTTKPARLPNLPPAPDPQGARTRAATTLPSMDRVWAAYVDALGQSSRPPGTATLLSGWDDRSEGRYSRIDLAVTPDRYRAMLVTAQDTTIQGLDSAGVWVFAANKLQRLSSPADVARVRRLAMRYVPLKDRPANLAVIGVERVGDRDAYVARARLDSISTWTAYFDVVSGLLRRETTTMETLLIPLQEQVDYDDYRDVGGVKVPFVVRMSDGAPYSTVTRAFYQVRHNVPVSDTLFRPPTR